MAELKHIAKETILILGLQGAGNECLATILDAHPELHVPGRVESQSESGKFHFSYDIKSPSSLRFYPPKYNENTEDVMYEILEQSEQLTYREDGPPLIYGSHQFYDYTASIFENLKIIEIANMVKNTLNISIPIKIIKSNDMRSYHISSAKVKKEFGFNTVKNISDAIIEIDKASKKQLIKDPLNNSNYYNINKMKELNLI